ncbi:MAG: hypothetical protein QM820_50315 [Minicystis sp.]
MGTIVWWVMIVFGPLAVHRPGSVSVKTCWQVMNPSGGVPVGVTTGGVPSTSTAEAASSVGPSVEGSPRKQLAAVKTVVIEDKTRTYVRIMVHPRTVMPAARGRGPLV